MNVVTRKRINLAGLAFLAAGGLTSFLGLAAGQQSLPTFEAYLRKSVVDKRTLDVFPSPKELSWAKFDPVTGYQLGNYLPRDGINGSSTISTTQGDGARTAQIYAHQRCRINTYGDSFTQCHQVNDSETWQEYLAGHLGEPDPQFRDGGVRRLPELSPAHSGRTDRTWRALRDSLHLGR